MDLNLVFAQFCPPPSGSLLWSWGHEDGETAFLPCHLSIQLFSATTGQTDYDVCLTITNSAVSFSWHLITQNPLFSQKKGQQHIVAMLSVVSPDFLFFCIRAHRHTHTFTGDLVVECCCFDHYSALHTCAVKPTDTPKTAALQLSHSRPWLQVIAPVGSWFGVFPPRH